MKETVFNWEIQQLVKNVTLDYTNYKQLEKQFWDIKKKLESLSSVSVADVSSALENTGIRIPFPSDIPHAELDSNLILDAPVSARVVGSFMLKSVVSSKSMNADLAFELPKSLFEDRDCNNYVYAYKKAFYLAYLASIFSSSDDIMTLNFDLISNDFLRPTLVLSSKNFAGFSIRLIPCISDSTFKLARLIPSKNAVRPYLYDMSLQGQHESTWSPTPIYNSSVLADTCFTAHLNYVYHYMKLSDDSNGPFKNTLILLKVWAQQKQLVSLGFDSHIISLLLAWMFATKRISLQSSPFHALRVFFGWLSETDLASKPVYIGKCPEFTEFTGVCLIDMTGRVNLLARMTIEQYSYLRLSASMAIQLLDDKVEDGFTELFIRKRSFMSFDNFAKVDISTVKKEMARIEELANYGRFSSVVNFKMGRILGKALGSRVKCICISPPMQTIWNISTEFPADCTNFDIGFIVNSSECNRVTDLGPSPEDERASQEFRQLWGEKSELRKFPDGSLLEAVSWEIPSDSGFDERAKIFESAVTYILGRHFGISYDSMNYVGNQCYDMIRPSKVLVENAPKYAQQANSFSHVVKILDSFSRRLKDLDGLPLSIVECRASHPSLRYSSLFIPQDRRPYVFGKDDVPPYHEAMDVIFKLESSNRWPTELKPIQMTKASFYCTAASLINENWPGSNATVTKGKISQDDPNGESIHAAGYLEVTVTEGYTFRCQIHHEYELSLLKSELINPKTSAERKKILHYAINEYNMHLIYRPLHSQLIQAAVHMYPHLSATIRLVKRWLASQFICIPEEAIELICKSVFDCNAPGTAWSAFCKVLVRLADWDFLCDPLIVSLEDDLPMEIIERLIMVHSKWRESDPMATENSLYVVPAVQRESYVGDDWNLPIWSSKVSKVLVSRMKVLAKSTIDLMISHPDLPFSSIFMHSTGAYDVILHMNPKKCPRLYESLNPIEFEAKEQFKNDAGLLVVDFDPAALLFNDLERLFGDLGAICRDKYGGTIIAISFNPSVINKPVPFRTNLRYPFEIVEDGKVMFVKVDMKQVLYQITKVGTGLVQRIELGSSLSKLLN